MTASEESVGADSMVGVIAISKDDHWAHAYEDERSAVAETSLGRPGQDRADVEFFDGSGRSLTPEYGSEGRLTALRSGDSAADPDALQQRLRAVVAYAGEYLSQHPAEVGEALEHEGISADQARQQLPDLDGGSLEEDLRRSRSLFGPHPMDKALQHRAGWWHNWVAHGILP